MTLPFNSPEAIQKRVIRAARERGERETRILEAAIAMAKADGYQWITRAEVARAAACSAGSVNHAYGRMIELKRAVMRAAVDRGIVEIVAQGLADGSAIAATAPADLKQKASAFIAS